jgi:hypothetical protein
MECLPPIFCRLDFSLSRRRLYFVLSMFHRLTEDLRRVLVYNLFAATITVAVTIAIAVAIATAKPSRSCSRHS